MTKLPRPLLAAFVVLAFISLNCSLAQSVLDRVKTSGPVAKLSADQEDETTRRRPTLRPTFTPTPYYTETPTSTPTPTITPIPTDTYTPVPTDTPTITPTPLPTDTPVPTNTSPPPPPTDTPAPVPTPTPDWPFRVIERGDRAIQGTTYHVITILVAVIDGNNTPIGGIKMVGDHVPSGAHKESPLSDWSYSKANCLDCSYIKQGNLQFEPGVFEDGTWNVYLADNNGSPLSEVIPLSYAADPNQWVWDFIIFQKK
ncbi:MAG: hypothetical protein JW953_04295 [Anaerolineae bacterium]|nr:hypothetical protein [Anaerolineae bacterium]